MPVISTSSPSFSNVVKSEFAPELGYCREQVVINDTAQTIKVGTVLGKITASGKYRVALSASADGSQTPVAVYIGNGIGESSDLVLPAATDTFAFVLARGPAIVADTGLTLGTGITAAAAKAGLQALNPPVLVEVQA